MTAGIGRFVLASAALHLGLLTALNLHQQAQPQLSPAVLNVALDELPAASPLNPARASARGSAAAAKRNPRRSPPRPAAIFPGAAERDGGAPPDLPDHTPIAEQQNQNDATAPRIDANDPLLDSASKGAAAGAANLAIPAEKTRTAAQGADAEIAGIAAQTAVPRSDAAALSSKLADRLRNALAPYFAYPMLARRNGWEGQVAVGLRVEPDGRLSHVRITRSSGYRLLDSAALAALSRIGILPDAAGWLAGRHFDMVLPVAYRLIDGQS